MPYVCGVAKLSGDTLIIILVSYSKIITQHDNLQPTTPSYSEMCVIMGIPRQYKTVQSDIVCQFHLINY
jgi:hypothetical protein